MASRGRRRIRTNGLRIVVTSQHRYESTPDGRVWTDGKYPYSFWTRYLSVFNEVCVVARMRRIPQPDDSARPADRPAAAWQPVSGDGVQVFAAPFVRGAWQWLAQLAELRRVARGAVGQRDAVMLRVPGEMACCLDTWLWKHKRPYGVECVGDPDELYAPGAVKSVFRPALRFWYPPRLRRECARACVAAYVTEHSLQRKYPPSPMTFSTHYSSIELDDAAFAAAPRQFASDPRRFSLIFVGTLAQLYKAPDVTIDAVAECVRGGVDLHLTIVGDGKHRGELEQRAARHGMAERVRFAGQLHSAADVRAELDQADLFVSPSRQEGLPRAMIEAMARGLPCIGSTVGGTAELLPDQNLVRPGDVRELAAAIRHILRDPAEMTRQAARNLAKAREYHADVLKRRRDVLYAELKQRTETWAPR